ncbi:hypothetical protein KR032_007069, partial [Drosophila birchii]
IFLAPEKSQAEELTKPEWSKFAKCSHLLIESASNLARNIFPTFYELNKCSGFVQTPPPNGVRSLLWYAKIIYDFFSKLVLDQPKCLLNLLNKVTGILKPYANEFSIIGCLDDEDFFV